MNKISRKTRNKLLIRNNVSSILNNFKTSVIHWFYLGFYEFSIQFFPGTPNGIFQVRFGVELPSIVVNQSWQHSPYAF